MSYIRKFLEFLQHAVFPRLRTLEQELDASRLAQAAADAELAGLREDLQQTRERDARQIAGLRGQVQAAESERSAAHSRIERLEHALAEAEQNRIATAERVGTLEARLEEERDRHAASTLAAETGLAKLQEGQQSLLARQGELADTIGQAAAGLIETLHAARDKPRRSLPLLLLAGVVLFAAGLTLGTVILYGLPDGNKPLVALQQDIRTMSADIRRHLDTQEELLRGLARALDRLAPAEPATLGGDVPQHGTPVQASAEPQLDIRALQTGLITLGFDLGGAQPSGEPDRATRRAVQEFRRLYMTADEASGDLISAALAGQVREAAALVRADAARYTIAREVLGAIRLGSIRTGVDFSVLMDLARVESSYDPQARARESSASGLYQFKEESWLEAVGRYGARYGLQDYADGIRRMTAAGQDAADSHDPLREEVLALRFDPRLSTLLAADDIKRNLRNLAHRTQREPGRTELYLLHFFGPSGAARFLEVLEAKPAAIAGDIFPEAAARNRGVFRNRQSEPRTVAEVYHWLEGRFNGASDDGRDPG